MSPFTLDRHGHIVRRRPRLCPRPMEGASWHDRGLGLLAGRQIARSHGGSVIGSTWLADKGAPTNNGSSSGPAGILDFTPTTAPPTAKASVPRSCPGATGGNQLIAAGAAPPDADHARATIDATSPTQATRRYCMTATRLMSPPKASAISSMAVAACYALVGWSIGLRFTRGIVLHALKQLPKIFASIFALIAMCGGLAFALHEAAGTDPLTAYLATSPGGADAVAIVAASSPVDIPFVMAMQIGRLLMVILIGPSLARMIARWTVGAEPASSGIQASE
ncbi:MAG: AbrB family transcriptional regulator [Candidatus Eremiobacteraeota bacterium]|nr:AbrB family transcriptional regulator [Candidatus Eremiobacteraeota bacterium]